MASRTSCSVVLACLLTAAGCFGNDSESTPSQGALPSRSECIVRLAIEGADEDGARSRRLGVAIARYFDARNKGSEDDRFALFARSNVSPGVYYVVLRKDCESRYEAARDLVLEPAFRDSVGAVSIDVGPFVPGRETIEFEGDSWSDSDDL